MMENSTILIVDDNQEIREIIEILLTGEGFQAVQAKDGMTALELLKEREFDLIILDIMMPGMNGYQTCLEIRKMSNAPFKGENIPFRLEKVPPIRVLLFSG